MTTMTTITETGAGGRPVDSGWRTASRGGWCPQHDGGCDPRSGKVVGCTPPATRVLVARPASLVIGRTRYWYVHPLYSIIHFNLKLFQVK
jgi:hypothetical protein